MRRGKARAVGRYPFGGRSDGGARRGRTTTSSVGAPRAPTVIVTASWRSYQRSTSSASCGGAADREGELLDRERVHGHGADHRLEELASVRAVHGDRSSHLGAAEGDPLGLQTGPGVTEHPLMSIPRAEFLRMLAEDPSASALAVDASQREAERLALSVLRRAQGDFFSFAELLGDIEAIPHPDEETEAHLAVVLAVEPALKHLAAMGDIEAYVRRGSVYFAAKPGA